MGCKNMSLNKVKQGSNMYQFCQATWNAIKGVCDHKCQYCYMVPIWERANNTKVHLDEKEFKVGLGKGQIIFVGSSTDMFADNIPAEWIDKVLDHCKEFYMNTYIFQSKNPKRFLTHRFPQKTIFGTTIETNRQELINQFSKAPSVAERSKEMSLLVDQRKMITIEPIMDFDLQPMVDLCKQVNPEFINIGANSRYDIKLPEPSKNKVLDLIALLSDFTTVNKKDNLARILK